jgi:squalene-hopene/tetraprenyl-beta-curcumene cyclase
VERATARALRFLAKQQRADGAWVPLWFGNEHATDDENPVYGTTHVLFALRELAEAGERAATPLAQRAAAWLVSVQNPDGGWGGARGVESSTEETALAVKALARTEHVAATDRGAAWLVERIENGTWREPSPIGFYFAKLWYYERIYPLVWTVGALGRAIS